MELLKDAGVDLTSPFAPVALVLRSGEAIDAVRNFAATGGADTGMEAAGRCCGSCSWAASCTSPCCCRR